MRKYYIDYLRVCAIIAVITIHVTAYYFTKFDEISRIDWWMSNLLNSASRFSVPLFIMISGAVLLGRNFSVSEFYKKRAMRLLPAIFFWNIFYIGFSLFKGMELSGLIWMLKVGLFAQGRAAVHLWYLPMFSCLMLFVPFINKWLIGDKPSSEDLRILYYAIFFFFLLNGISSIMDNILEIKIEWFKVFPWFIAYFIGGYYIDKYGKNFSVSNTKILSGIILLILTGSIINYFMAHHFGIFKDRLFLITTGPFVFIITFLIFLFTKVNSHIFRENKIVARVSEASFGMYLIHPVFIHFLRDLLPAYSSHALIYIPLTILLTTLVSFYFIVVLRKLSFMKTIC